MKKILILSANPISTNRLRLDEEVREIRSALRGAPNREAFQLIPIGAAHIDDLRQMLLENNPEIVHFSGHGTGTDGLVLENASGQPQIVSTESLSNLFELFRDKIKCVFLNACYSEIQASAIHKHIDCVIGMAQPIQDHAAINFSRAFYDAIFSGRNYADAFEFGRNNIDLNNIPGSNSPNIFIKTMSSPKFLTIKDVSAISLTRLENYVNCYKKLEDIKNPRAKEQLIRILDMASQLKYVIVGAPRIYQHDSEILAGMNSGDIYRATHPFSANKKAYYVESAQFKAYTKAQIEAANKGAIIKRLYIMPTKSFDALSPLEKKHLYDISEKRIDSRIIYLSNIPDDDLGEDFVIFDNSLLGVAIPKRGEMLGSEYLYSIDSNVDTIEKYKRYFDTLFKGASLLKDYLRSVNTIPVPSPITKSENATHPAFILQTAVSLNGQRTKRLMIVLRTAGCTYDQKNMGCAMCDFKRHAVSREMINSNILMEQLEYSLNQAIFSPDYVSQIDLLSLGSFLHNNEVPEEFRILAFQKFSTIKDIKKIVIESRSEYIQSKSLLSLKNLLREDQILEIGLGIESSDESIRNNVLRKNLSNTEIRGVVDVCAKTGVEFLAYLLIGSMTLTEDEAVQDAINSANYIANLCNSKNVKFRIAFEPVFITHGTELEKMYLEGNYNLINLWRVIDVIKSVSHLGTIFVGLSDEGLSSNRISSGCHLCTDDLREAIEKFNGSQSVEEFEGLICKCQTTSL